MNKPKPIDTALSKDLRGSWLALLRAAARARQVAMQTGTALVVMRNGMLEHLYPLPEPTIDRIQERGPGYGESS